MQIGALTAHTEAVCSMLAAVMQLPAYQALRTRAQLGYVVDVDPCHHCGVCGIALCVGGGLRTAASAAAHVDAFLDRFGRELARMPKGDYAALRSSTAAEAVRAHMHALHA
jgi:secreted Zn-dependent insulinase-like peptidase